MFGDAAVTANQRIVSWYLDLGFAHAQSIFASHGMGVIIAPGPVLSKCSCLLSIDWWTYILLQFSLLLHFVRKPSKSSSILSLALTAESPFARSAIISNQANAYSGKNFDIALPPFVQTSLALNFTTTILPAKSQTTSLLL